MNIPEMFPVSSSNVESVGYDEESQIVFVQFLNGSMYIYKGVEKHQFENLRDADSIGSYLHRNYKNVYPYEKIQ
jgi:hypothetical protein